MRRQKGNDPAVVRKDLQTIGLTRVCCIRMILTGSQQVASKVEGRFNRPSKAERQRLQHEEREAHKKFVESVLGPKKNLEE